MKMKPEKVIKILCPKCKELQVKIYPWSNVRWIKGDIIPKCKKCINSSLKSGVAQ